MQGRSGLSRVTRGYIAYASNREQHIQQPNAAALPGEINLRNIIGVVKVDGSPSDSARDSRTIPCWRIPTESPGHFDHPSSKRGILGGFCCSRPNRDSALDPVKRRLMRVVGRGIECRES